MIPTLRRRNPPSHRERHLTRLERALRTAIVRLPRDATPAQRHDRSMALLKAIGQYASVLQGLVRELHQVEETAATMPHHPDGIAARRRMQEILALLNRADRDLRDVRS